MAEIDADAPIRVRTVGGREAIVIEKMGKGWFSVELDANANNEGGAGERKKMRLTAFAPAQDHLLDAAPMAAPKPKADAPPMVRPKRNGDPVDLARKAEAERRRKEAEDKHAAFLEAERKRNREEKDHIVKHDWGEENTRTNKIRCRVGPLRSDEWHPDSKSLRKRFEASLAASSRGRRQELADAARKRKETGESAPPRRRRALSQPPPSSDAAPPRKKKPSSKKQAGRAPLAELQQDEAPEARPPARAARKRGTPGARRQAASQRDKRTACDPSWLRSAEPVASVNELSATRELQDRYENELRVALAEKQAFLLKPTNARLRFITKVTEGYDELFDTLGLGRWKPPFLVPLHPNACIGMNSGWGFAGECYRTFYQADEMVDEDPSLDLAVVFNDLASKNGFLDKAICALCGCQFSEAHLGDLREHFDFFILLDNGRASCPEAVFLLPTPLVNLFKNDSDLALLERFLGTARFRHVTSLIGNASRQRATAEQACVRWTVPVPHLPSVADEIDEGPPLDRFVADLRKSLAIAEPRQAAAQERAAAAAPTRPAEARVSVAEILALASGRDAVDAAALEALVARARQAAAQ